MNEHKNCKWVLTDEAKSRVLRTLADEGFLTLRIVHEKTNELIVRGMFEDDPILELGPFTVEPGDSLTLQGVKFRLELDL